jgi:hypothetical protein
MKPLAVFRFARDFLLNSVAATLGVAILESSVHHAFHQKTFTEIYVEAVFLDAAIAFLLGFFVYFKWKAQAALLVWVIGVCTFVWRLTLGNPRSLDEEVNWAVIDFVSVRAVFYSIGAVCCYLWITSRRTPLPALEDTAAVDPPAQPEIH